MKLRSLDGLFCHSAFHFWSAQLAALRPVFWKSSRSFNAASIQMGVKIKAVETVLCEQIYDGAGGKAPSLDGLETEGLFHGEA